MIRNDDFLAFYILLYFAMKIKIMFSFLSVYICKLVLSMVQWHTPLGFRDKRLLMKLLFNHQVEMVKNKWHHCPDI